MKYKADGVPLVVIAGKEYGTGSSRDWAAKGTNLLGVKAVIAESFERIHRSNLVGMGVLPLQFIDGENAHRSAWTVRKRSTSPAWPMVRRRPPRSRRRKPAAARSPSRPGCCCHAEGSRLLPARWPAAIRAAATGGQASGMTFGRARTRP
jgi:hypothetical protein